MMRVQLFGKPHIISDDGQTVTLPTSKDRALLAYVLFHGPVERSVLIDLFWPNVVDGRRNLTQSLSVFRQRGLEDIITMNRQVVQPTPLAEKAVDCLQFDRLLAVASEHDDSARLARLTEAAALYRGAFVQERLPHTIALEVDEWVQRQRRQYQEAARAVLHELVVIHQAAGELDVAQHHAEHLIALDPLDDRGYRELMQIYAQSGDLLRIVRLYDQLCRILKRELGIRPPAETQALYDTLVCGKATNTGEALPDSALPDKPAATTMPVSLAPLIGRDMLVAELDRRLTGSARLLVLVGSGGVGKTRLALHMANQMAMQGRFQDGVQVVELADLTSCESTAVVRAIARQFGVPLDRQDNPLAQLAHFLRARQMLLVLDDLDGIQDMGVLLSEILRLAPGLHLLLTARERLHLRDAQTILVPPLAIPQTSDPEEVDTSSAVQLFVERARWEQPDFALTEEIAPHVVHICQLLDGLPLAIELAAAWVGALDCQTLAEELACDLDFLSSRAPDDVPARHQGLRAVFVSSWQRLTTEQQRVLAALAVFRSPVAREVARAVTDATSATLAALVDTSLLRRGADQRLVLPTSLRQYAAEQLAESGAQLQVTQRYTQIMLQRVSDQTTALRGSQQQSVLHAVQRELPDIEVAWGFAVNQRDVTLIQETAPALFHLYDIPSDFERGAWLFGLAHAALNPDIGTDMALAWGVVTSRYAWFRWHQGARDEALLLLEHARDVLAPLDTAAVVFAHNYLGAMAMHRHDHDQAVIHCEAGQQIAQRVGDRYGEAIAGNIRAQVALEQGDLVEARQWARHSYLLEQQIGNRWSSAYSLTTLGREALARGDLDDARHHLSGALDIRQDMGDRRGQALCLGFLGDTLVAQQAFTQADDHYRAALVRYRDLGNDRGVAEIITRMLRYRTSVGSDRAALALIHDGLHAALRAGPPVGELANLLATAVPILRAIDPVLADELMVGSKTRSVAWNFYAAQAWQVLAQTTLGLPSTDQHALLDFNVVSRSSKDAGDQ